MEDSPAASAEKSSQDLSAPLAAAGDLPLDANDIHPRLFLDKSFWGITLTQFLGAYNDNLFKQLMLLLAISVGVGAAGNVDQQGMAMIVFSLPFVLFSGYAGYLSDRHSKRRVIVIAKLAEIGIMALGMIGFLLYGTFGYGGLLFVLFLMGTHSAFFGPGKYGVLPELFRKTDLARANAIVLMTTFMAIILGTVSAGVLGDLLHDSTQGVRDPTGLWVGSLFCIGVAVVGTGTSLLIRKLKPADSKLRFQWSSLTVPPEARRLLRNDRPLVLALLASCVFWLVSGLAMSSVNSLGKIQLDLSDGKTSVLPGIVGLGIAVGAVIAGKICKQRIEGRVVRFGAWGMVVLFVLLSISVPGGDHLLGFLGSLPVLLLAGIAVGLFAIPVQVFIQTRPPESLKGRVIALMNQVNFIAILLSGVVYSAFDALVNAIEGPRSVLFLLIALVMLPVAIWYRPKSESLL